MYICRKLRNYMESENMTLFRAGKTPGRIAAGFLMALILLGIGGAWFYHSQADAARRDALARLERIGHDKAAAIADWRKAQLEDADKVMKTPFFVREVIRFLTDPGGHHAHLLEIRLGSLQSGYHYDEIRVLDTRGRVRLGRSMATENQDIFAAAVKDALERGRPVFVRMHRCGVHAKPCVSVVAPVFGQDPASVLPDFRPMGAIVLGRAAGQTLYPLLQAWPVPSTTAETLLIRRDEDEIVFLSDLALYPDSALKLRVPLNQEKMLVAMAGMGNQEVVQSKDYRGEEVVAALLPVPDSPWLLVAKQDAAEVFAQWRTRSDFLLTLFAALAGIASVIGLLSWQRDKAARYRHLYETEARLRLEEKRYRRTLEEKETLAAQLIQSQKMESVGRLAGGVAHDYNNMLNVILGYAELAMATVDPSDPMHETLKKIHHAATRSADITRQLLAFARKQPFDPRVLDLNETIEGGLISILKRLIGEDIDLSWRPGHDLWPVKMDPSQVDQILANLCVNARDAIGDVGKITIETGNQSLDSVSCANHPGLIPGDFVLLAVSDNGCGMDQATLQKVFEPFFTTKPPGKGTGLGLATVYGIVKQNNGFVYVYSELEEGTTIKVYLARHSGKK